MRCPYCNRHSARGYCDNCRCFITEDTCLTCESQLVEVDPPPPIPGGPYFYCQQCSENGPSESQIEDQAQWQAPRRFTMADKDAPEDYRG
jgi:hypothetical protein